MWFKAFAFVLLSAVVMMLLGGLVLLCLRPMASVSIEEFCRPRVRQPFAVEAWKQTAPGDSVRYKMANDLIRSDRLEGMNSESVHDALGEPTYGQTNDPIIRLYFELVRQKFLPSRCIFFTFLNIENWVLEVEIRDGKVVKTRMRAS